MWETRFGLNMASAIRCTSDRTASSQGRSSMRTSDASSDVSICIFIEGN